MNLRRAIKEDAKKIAEISRVAFEAAFRNKVNADEVDGYLAALDTEYFEASMKSPICRFLVVTDKKDEVFGFAQVIEKGPPDGFNKSWLKLERLYLDPERIGTGAGKLMMEGFMEMAHQDAVDNVWLEVLNSNKRAVKFYDRLGFETFDTCPGKFKGDESYDLRMKKVLSV